VRQPRNCGASVWYLFYFLLKRYTTANSPAIVKIASNVGVGIGVGVGNGLSVGVTGCVTSGVTKGANVGAGVSAATNGLGSLGSQI
jgi:hypothetical protein